MLAPSNARTLPEEEEGLAMAEEGGREDEPAEADSSQVAGLSPASIGLSFSVEQEATGILLTARWGQYLRRHSEIVTNTRGQPVTIWKRYQRGSGPHLIELREGPIDIWRPEPDEQPEVHVKGLVRHANDRWIVTLFLVNGQKEPKRLRDQAWLFQPELIVESPGNAPIFRQRNGIELERSTPEERATAMLYRHHVSFAIGHGISVHAETLPGDTTCAYQLETRVVPSYDIPRTESPSEAELPALQGLVLDMQVLAMSTPSELPTLLQPLVTAYATWIEAQEQRLTDPSSDLVCYVEVAHEVLNQCRRTLERIQSGIRQLETDASARQAFQFMNRAMWLQRIHALYAEERRRDSSATLADMDKSINRSWRPFQLAFILLNLPALTDLHHSERSAQAGAIADLLWFPTGGGKTEAYLGLTSYTLAIRRLQGVIEGRSGQDGVAVIMRYTLRLLTLQQFQRAASLICACEMLRRADSAIWGTTPFRLGLWVGQRSTPNTTQDSERAIEEERGIRSTPTAFGGFANIGSPHQLTHCPWCGAPIDAGKNIVIERYSQGRSRTLTYCGDPYGQCMFSKAKSPNEGLPVLVVDEEIYRLLPALLIATVDKFAQLPWKGETQMLFGKVEKYCPRHGFRSADLDDADSHPATGRFPRVKSMPHAPLRPPDLIIQDELHLIAGPLGTLVGLYETAVDHLATWQVDGRAVRPKVIAATATIRRAEQQVKSLFLRRVSIFPPQGLDIEDNFFSRQRPPSTDMPGRRYIGICASGRRLKAALIRVYVAHLAAAQVLYERYGLAADPWMTLVGYFNSMSELGGVRRLVEDDVTSCLRKMDERGLARRTRPIVEELTSRKSSSQIPKVLSRLEQSFRDPRSDTTTNATSTNTSPTQTAAEEQLGETSTTSAPGIPRPIDVLLATNMISVGVDVKRLGLMVVTGQPKTTAEYVQATSRIGRIHPGLVCVVYNWSRPRDISHYEQFEHYHATFYQQVEALSVTPFAPRALDRGLAALLTSYVRLTNTQFSKNEAASEVDSEEAAPYFEQAIKQITARADEITNEAEAVLRVRDDLEKLQDYWLRKARSLSGLGYKTRNDGRTLGLLKDPEQGNWEPFTCLNSLRDVEPMVQLILDERDLGEPIRNGGY
jgi:Helicase conserved C-terminal domain